MTALELLDFGVFHINRPTEVSDGSGARASATQELQTSATQPQIFSLERSKSELHSSSFCKGNMKKKIYIICMYNLF